jgi:hypothetical protein
MRIGLSALDFDPIGHMMVEAKPEPDITRRARRVNAIQTMDPGGIVLLDRGAPVGGAQWPITWVGPAGREVARWLVQVYPLIRVSTSDGVFVAAPLEIEERGREITLVVIIKEQLA